MDKGAPSRGLTRSCTFPTRFKLRRLVLVFKSNACSEMLILFWAICIGTRRIIDSDSRCIFPWEPMEKVSRLFSTIDAFDEYGRRTAKKTIDCEILDIIMNFYLVMDIFYEQVAATQFVFRVGVCHA
eukprot:gnl/MRDRNA2_/MRDRNA2_118516_c0_seq1.p2 gnl/MRDRNA2_/MRDRNA2_118516_c0~~gnl/MRDRNA2_/MRDRNA2_118516_c0_seq1.p2  ORF type:complete len:127 (-),score=13.90 gnl/MRDRNA2_/MRDRNA2_118516_c0_seq1:14-394(-)